MLTQVNRCLRRLTGRSREFLIRFETYYTYNKNNNSYNNTIANGNSLSSFDSFGSQLHYEGLNYKSTKSEYNYRSKDKEYDLKEEKIFGKGDVVNISQLLFTKKRDYLIRHNDPQLVTAEQLAGKVIVIFFVPLHLDSDCLEREFTISLMDTYNDLKFKNCFEVVLVVVDDVTSFDADQSKFEYILSQCPSWPAIPFSDITTRKRLKRRFGLFRRLFDPEEVLIDSTGMVLDNFPQKLFYAYGSEAYPFSDEMIASLKSKDKTAFHQPSLKALLGSSDRDFVISNSGDEVPIHTLEDKVVALYFYEDGVTSDFVTEKLKIYYEELTKSNRNFEVVLCYLHDTDETILSTNKETFGNTFKTMPWLALPYKDPTHKKLKRIFGYPDHVPDESSKPTLVIVGPRRDIIETDAAIILRGYDANQFRCKEFAKAEAERVRELKLEMLCSPNTVFRRKDGSQVQFSQLAGKKIIFLLEGDYPEYDGLHFRKELKERYMKMKGTADEFEVIYFPNSKDKNGKRVADVPWLVSGADEMLHGCSAFLSYYRRSDNRYQSSFLLAFGRNGRLVRRTMCPQFGDKDFPFRAYGVAIEDFVDIGSSNFCWGYWDTLYQGLLKYSAKQFNFPSGDLLFCIHYYQCSRKR